MHRYAEARQSLTEAHNIYVEVHGRGDPEVVDLLNNLAAACLHVCCFAKHLQLFNNIRTKHCRQTILKPLIVT